MTGGLDGPNAGNDALDKLIMGVENLPPTPALVTNLLAIFKQPDVDVDRVVKLIRNDPPLTAEVLRRCNSAYFAGEQVSDIFDAVTRLGFYQVYRVVVTIAGSRTMRAVPAGCGLRLEELWEHSFETAVAAGLIAHKLKEPDGAAFTAGLLHDVGKIVLASAGGAKYAMLKEMASVPGVTLPSVEADMFGFDHAAVGGRLLNRWKLPPEVTAAVAGHHDFLKAGPHTRLAATVAVADTVAHSLREEAEGKPLCFTNCLHALGFLGLDHEDGLQILERVKCDLEQEQGMMATL